MTRPVVLAAAVGATFAAGCASTWDVVSSRRFRESPGQTLFGTGPDPLTVMRSSPVADERGRAMLALAEPGPQKGADQDEALKLLGQAVATDPSPFVRLAAADALGRFTDPRAADALVVAYGTAPGKPAADKPETRASIRTAGGRMPATVADLRGPQGFPADQAAGLRVRILDGLARHGTPAAVETLARAATDREPADLDDPLARDTVRQAAVRNLGAVRKPEAVTALAKVLSAESGRDITVATLAHDGLKGLTGKDLPADPQQWDAVVQAGAVVVPERNAVQRAVGLDFGR